MGMHDFPPSLSIVGIVALLSVISSILQFSPTCLQAVFFYVNELVQEFKSLKRMPALMIQEIRCVSKQPRHRLEEAEAATTRPA